MRRKPGILLPIELSILVAGIEPLTGGAKEFHGFLIAKEIKEHQGAKLLTAHGTRYKALDRMESAGLLVSRWEDPMLAAEEGRPRRRLYQITVAGQVALAKSRGAPPQEGQELEGRPATA